LAQVAQVALMVFHHKELTETIQFLVQLHLPAAVVVVDYFQLLMQQLTVQMAVLAVAPVVQTQLLLVGQHLQVVKVLQVETVMFHLMQLAAAAAQVLLVVTQVAPGLAAQVARVGQ
jgi:hypothetical protein